MKNPCNDSYYVLAEPLVEPLNRWREEEGLPWYLLAGRVGVDEGTLRKIARGQRAVTTLTVANKIALTLDRLDLVDEVLTKQQYVQHLLKTGRGGFLR